MRCTDILKNNSTAEKRREEEAFALESIAHYCFVETKTNCGHGHGKVWVGIVLLHLSKLRVSHAFWDIKLTWDIFDNFGFFQSNYLYKGLTLIQHRVVFLIWRLW